MRSQLSKKISVLALGVGMVLCFTMDASASILITPTTVPQWNGDDPNNPKADDIETITGFAGELLELYKQDVGGPESGSFAGSYTTTFDKEPDDPEDSWIVWDGGAFIDDAEFLLVKDGKDPVWYIFDISAWDGMMDIHIEGFWPDMGAISHVSIYGGEGEGVIPEPASMIVWGLLASVGLCVGWRRRRRAA